MIRKLAVFERTDLGRFKCLAFEIKPATDNERSEGAEPCRKRRRLFVDK